ncbi:MAG TPA: hypothetical protein VF661_08145, partial [Actinomycetales bacterium]
EVVDEARTGRTFLQTAVPADSLVERMALTRRPVVLSDPPSRSALAYRKLWRECLPLLGLPTA